MSAADQETLQRVREFKATKSPGEAASLEDGKRNEEERAEALRILESEDPLTEIKKHLDNLIAGEDATKQLVFLLCLSGKIRDAKKKQIVELLGEAGGGKTTIANAITQLFKTKKIGRFSKRALDYSDLQGYEILYLQEIGAMDKEEQGVSTLKFLSADDQGYTVEITVFDQEAKAFTTQEIRIPPITVVTCTTRTDVDVQFDRRSWPINVDETLPQTMKIKAWKIKEKQEDALIALGLEYDPRTDKSKRILTHLVNLIDDVTVFLPFPENIFDILEFETAKIRVRGDMDKFWILVYLYNVLLQRKLLKENINERTVVCASPALTAKMLTITKNPLIVMTLGLEGRYLVFIEAVRAAGFSQRGARVTMAGRDEIKRKHGRSENTVYRYLDDLFKKGFFSKETVERGVVEFVLRDDLDALLQSQSDIAGKLEIPSVLGLKMVKEAQNFIEGVVGKRLQNPHPQNHEMVVSLLQAFSNRLSDEEKELSEQIKAEAFGKSEIPPEKPPASIDATKTSQEIMDWVLGELSCVEEASVDELVEKSNLPRKDIQRILDIMQSDGVIFMHRVDWWKKT